MALNISGIVDAVESAVQALGLFDTVNLYETKTVPSTGLTCNIWADKVGPAPAASGLAETAGLVVMAVRIYTPMLQEPFDMIDPSMVAAVDALLGAFSGTFTLGGLIRDVDLLGEFGVPLSAQAGYVTQSGQLSRVMTVTLPLVLNDVWGQAA